jgi:hypothetical protein
MNPTKIRCFINRYWILLFLILIKFVLQYTLVNPVYELHRDEFLHLDQANHLAFGYISVPPFTSVISKIIYLLGGDITIIRFVPALFGALTIVFTWLIVESIEGSLLSRILASSALLFSVLVRMNILYQPNSFDILAWTIIFYFLIKFVKSEKTKWLYYLAVVVAMGIYNKYNLVFLIFGLTAGLLLTSKRRILTNRSFWKALLLLAILILPNLTWQVANRFPVVQHMSELKATQLDNNTSIGFLKDQVMFFSGSLLLVAGALIAFACFKPFKQYRFIGICFVTVILLFTYLKAKNYYAFGLYPVIIAFGSVYIEKLLTQKWRMVVVPVLMGINLAVFILTAKVVYPVLSPTGIRQNSAVFEKFGMLRWEDGKNHLLPQDFADMIGWKEMAEKSLRAYKIVPENELENTLVFCDNYGQTGALNYYNRGKMPEAYSFNTDYIFWLPHLTRIKNIVMVGNKPDKEIIEMFSGIQLVGKVENELAREKGTCIWLFTGASDDFTSAFYNLADERIRTLDIF